MARQTKPLSAKEIDAAKPKQSNYVLYDGDGLELLVKSNGSKLWSFRYIRPLTKKRAKTSNQRLHHSAVTTLRRKEGTPS